VRHASTGTRAPCSGSLSVICRWRGGGRRKDLSQGHWLAEGRARVTVGGCHARASHGHGASANGRLLTCALRWELEGGRGRIRRRRLPRPVDRCSSSPGPAPGPSRTGRSESRVRATVTGTRLAAAARARAVTVLRYIRTNVTVLREREPTNLSGYFPGGVTFWWLDFHELSRRTSAAAAGRSRAPAMIGHRLGGLRSLSGQEPSLLPFTVTVNSKGS
jgi:hypothetical protein